jgi:hypothetical protein
MRLQKFRQTLSGPLLPSRPGQYLVHKTVKTFSIARFLLLLLVTLWMVVGIIYGVAAVLVRVAPHRLDREYRRLTVPFEELGGTQRV